MNIDLVQKEKDQLLNKIEELQNKINIFKE